MSAKLPPGTLEKLWSDPANWRLNAIYICKADPRYLVPKPIRWTGWTVNFAHTGAWIYFGVGVILTLAIAYAAIMTHQPAIMIETVALILAVSVMSGLWFSSPGRFEERN